MENVKYYKKEYKDLYQPKTTPTLVDVGEAQFIAVEGRGNPNEEKGEYKRAIEVLYGIQYTIKMSKKGNNIPKGYFDYVVPPLEGLCVQCLHIGAYDDEPTKTEISRLKTVLRVPVKKEK